MRDDGGGGSSSTNQKPDWTNSYTPLQVDVSSLRDYWRTMTVDLFARSMTSTSGVLAPMPEMINSGLAGMGGSIDPQSGVFPEGIVVAEIMNDAHSKFAAFFKDVSNGIMCIGDAAGVIAEMYSSGDAANKASLNDVLFAFNDPTANRPGNLPAGATTQSFADQQAQAAAAGGQYAMALTASNDQATSVIYPANGVTIYFFADGSSKTVTSSNESSSWAAGTTTTTSYYYNGKQVGSTTQANFTARGGYSYTTTTTSPTDDPNAPGSASTEVVTNPDGSQDITTTTVGSDGKPQVTSTVHVPKTDTTDKGGLDQGPVQQAEQQYQTQGGKDYVQQHGSGY